LVYANYFKVIVPKDLTLTRYNVEVSPEATGKKLARVFQLLIALPEFAGVATEWKSMIISQRPLNIQDGHTVEIPYLAEGADEPLPKATVYKVRIVTPLSFSISDFVNFLANPSAIAKFAHKVEAIQVMNAVFGHHPQSQNGIVSIAQNRHYDISRSPRNLQYNVQQLGGGLEALRGYFLSIRAATGGLLLNVNVTHGVFLEPETLDRLYPKLGTGNRTTLQKKLAKMRISVNHLPQKFNKAGQQVHRAKSVFGLAHPQDGRGPNVQHPPQILAFGAGPKDVKFWLDDKPATKPPSPKSGNVKKKSSPRQAAASTLPTKTYISVWDYFLKQYPQIKLDAKNPVVNVGNRENPTYLPAEVCLILPGQTIKRRLSPDQTSNMITFACRRPWENANSIVGDGKAVLGLSGGNNPTLARFGLAIGPQLVTVAARVLPPPSIRYKNPQNKEQSVLPRGGSWNMMNVKFHVGTNMGPWTYIHFRSDRGREYFSAEDLRATVMKFQRFLIASGVNAANFIPQPPPAIIELQDGNEAANESKINGIFRAMYTAPANARPRFVLCVLPYQDVAIYNSIKSVADTKAGIHTVCVVAQKFMKEQRQEQYFGNISLKFNLKAGGINQVLEPAKLGIISEGRTMLMGIDVTHPQPGAKETAPSVAGVVASVDKFLGQWPCDFAIQEARKEMVTALENMTLTRLNRWEKVNKNLPENIIVYRDGVSEGQYQTVLDQELPMIRNACRQKYPATATKQGFPRISIIICGKRHHTRFFPTNEGDADRSHNCEPGTIVDRTVTEAGNWDFFVQSHACLQGTARSGHYYVIMDEIFRSRPIKAPHTSAADALEELTHNMCHLFGRATKAVSLCPPAYYADLLCTRLRCYLAEQYDPTDTSATPSIASGSTPSEKVDIKIPETLKDSMFYI